MRRPRLRPARNGTVLLLCLALLSSASAAAAVLVSVQIGAVVALVPLALLGLASVAVPAALGVALLPMAQSVVEVPGLRLTVTDLLFGLALAGLLLTLLTQGGRLLRLPAALRIAMAIYFAGVLLAVVVHPGVAPALGAVQRLELVLLPLAIAPALSRSLARQALSGYIAVASAVAAVQVAAGPSSPGVLGLQKNPLGQFLAGALLLTLFAPRLPTFARGMAPLLGLGLAFSQSRGALLGLVCALSLAVLSLPGTSVTRLRRFVPLMVGLVLVLRFVPADVATRITDFSADQTAAGDAVSIRFAFRDDALALIVKHPLSGVGINQYKAGSASAGTETTDPHNVVLLEAAELGLPGAGAFVWLALVSVAVCFNRRRHCPWALAAAAVQTSTLVHSLFDVYWVRATPTLGWLLVGLAVENGRRVRGAADDDQPVLTVS